jgi:hypothetical protein
MSHKLKLNLEIDWEHQRICIHEPSVGIIRWQLSFHNSIVVIGDDQMAVTLTDTQKVSASIQPVDVHGHPALVDGIPVWTTSDPTLLEVVPSLDGMNAEILASGEIGIGQVIVEADADLGEGVVTLTGILDVTVIGGAAVALEISVGTPEEQ